MPTKHIGLFKRSLFVTLVLCEFPGSSALGRLEWSTAPGYFSDLKMTRHSGSPVPQGGPLHSEREREWWEVGEGGLPTPWTNLCLGSVFTPKACVSSPFCVARPAPAPGTVGLHVPAADQPCGELHSPLRGRVQPPGDGRGGAGATLPCPRVCCGGGGRRGLSVPPPKAGRPQLPGRAPDVPGSAQPPSNGDSSTTSVAPTQAWGSWQTVRGQGDGMGRALPGV